MTDTSRAEPRRPEADAAVAIGAFAIVALVLATGSLYYHWHVSGSELYRTVENDVLFVVIPATRILTIAAAVTIIRHRRRHLAAWLLLLAGTASTLAEVADRYVWFGYVVDRYGTTQSVAAHLPGRVYAGWAYGVLAATAGALWLVFIFVFPNGRLVSRRWRPVAAVVACVGAVRVVAAGLAASVVSSSVVSTPNPFRVHALNFLAKRLVVGSSARSILGLVSGALVAVAAASALARWRTSSDEELRPLRLFLVAIGLRVGAYVADISSLATSDRGAYLDDATRVLSASGAVLFGFAMVFAVFRTRMYEVEVVVRRTTVVSSLVLLVGVAYIAASSVVGTLAGQVAGGWFVPLSATAVAAVGLRPVWDAAERAAARVIVGDRPPASAVLRDVAARIAAVGDVDAVLPALADSLRRATGSSAVVVRLGTDPIASVVAGDEATSGATIEIPVAFAGHRSGELVLTRRATEPWTASDVVMLEAVAAEAGPALHNAIVLEDLRRELAMLDAQAEALARSRRRLATAQLEARSRFAGDVATLVLPEVDEVERRVAAGDMAAARLRAERALAAVRAIGHGLHPSELRDLGVGPALVSAARERRVVLQLEVADATRRWNAEVEEATFAALVAPVRAAGTRRARISLRDENDGIVFEAWSDAPAMADDVAVDVVDRVAVIDGAVTIDTASDGVRLRGWIPTGGEQ